jgi:hypothetical protein
MTETSMLSTPAQLAVSEYKVVIDVRSHVIQLEVLALAIILLQALILLQPAVALLIDRDASYLLPFAFLALIPFVVRVNNPESTLRSSLKWGVSGLGTGATIGGGITGALTGGLAAPAGALIGGAIGFVIGAVSGPFIEGDTKKVFTQGEAREYLIAKQKSHPELSMPMIVAATELVPSEPDCAVYMFVSDGMIKTTKAELLKWLESHCWRSHP